MNPVRIFLFLLAFFLLALLETGLFASLPGVLHAMPLVLAVGVYLVQSRGWWSGAWLIAALGLWLDVSGIAPVPFQTLAYGAAAVVVYLSARRLFSNQSLYGILGCGSAGWAAHTIVQTAIWIIQTLREPAPADFGAYAAMLGWRLVLLWVFLTALFYAAPRRLRIHVQR